MSRSQVLTVRVLSGIALLVVAMTQALAAAFVVINVSPAVINPDAGQTTTITYTVPRTANYEVYIRNAAGVTVSMLVTAVNKAAGTYATTWNGESSGAVAPNGTYTICVQDTKTGRGYTPITAGHNLINVVAVATTPPPTPPPTTPPPTTGTINSVTTIIDDMTLAPDAYPHGVPSSWGFAQGADIEDALPPAGWTAMTAWGEIYIPTTGNPATNTRVNYRNEQAYVLSKSTGKWELVQNSAAPYGSYYLENYSGDLNATGDQRVEPDGTISVVPGGGYCYNFYPADRGTINPSDVAGVFTTCEARLIVNNPSLPNDCATAKFILNSGGDYWSSLTSSYLPNDGANTGIGTGRFRYVTTSWQAYNFCTVPGTQLESNPPPLE